MRIDIKLSSIVLLTVVFLEARVHVREASLRKVLFNYLFPKDPGTVRVRRLEEVKTVNNVSILDFVSKSFINILFS